MIYCMVQNVIGRGRGFWVGSFLESVTPAGGFVTSLLTNFNLFFQKHKLRWWCWRWWCWRWWPWWPLTLTEHFLGARAMLTFHILHGSSSLPRLLPLSNKLLFLFLFSHLSINAHKLSAYTSQSFTPQCYPLSAVPDESWNIIKQNFS